MSKPPTHAQALAFASAVNLRLTDVPGFKVSAEHEHESPAEKALEAKMLGCTGGVGSNEGLLKADSKDFHREVGIVNEGVSSHITVVQSAPVAAREFAAMSNPRIRSCLAHYTNLLFGLLAKSPESNGMKATPVSITPLSISAPGMSVSFALRMTAAITDRGARIPFTMDLLGFAYGPAEVALFAYALPEPVPAATEQRLFSLLARRAIAHGLA